MHAVHVLFLLVCRHQLQLDELSRDHESEVLRLQDLVRRERERAVEERGQFQRDVEQVGAF
jgi:hypothetical protein